MNKRLLYTLGALALGAGQLLAVPAKPGPRSVTQPDGTVLTITVTGDERSHRVMTTDGLLLVHDEAVDGYTYAAVGADGLPVSSGVLAANPEARTLLPAGYDRAAVSEAFERMAARSARARAPRREDDVDEKNVGRFDTSFPVLGEQRALVVLVEYTDVAFTIEDPKDYFTRMLNEEGFSDEGGTGSARDWFVANSNGAFVPEFDVYGPVTLAQKRAYYGSNSGGNDRYPEKMMIEAADLLDDEIDFALYDRDGNGIVDNVFVVYAGLGENDGGPGTSVWPHAWSLSEDPYYNPEEYMHDGVALDHYACTCELNGPSGNNTTAGIGTFVHEFSHVMGLPDLYSTGYTGAFTPDAWDTLDVGPYNNDGRTPPNYSAYERYSLGWLEPEVLGTTALFELTPLHIDNKAYLIPTDRDKEFYILENRQQEGYDYYIPGHGMLVWHINFDKDIWKANIVNNSPSRQYVDLIEADNLQTRGSRAGDAFPGVDCVTEFGPNTVPALVNWFGEPLTDFNITDIQEIDGLITFELAHSSVGSIEASGDLRVWTIGGRLHANTGAAVYDMMGRKVGTVSADEPFAPGATGIYVVSCEKGTVKVILK